MTKPKNVANLCDSNIWLALVLSKHGYHARVREWIESIQAPASIVLCRAAQQTFLRLLTNTTVLGAYGNPPLTNQHAWALCSDLLADDRITFSTQEPAGIEEYWKKFACRRAASPKLWMDAYLAAYAVASGFRMVTVDSGYRQFDGLDLLILGSR